MGGSQSSPSPGQNAPLLSMPMCGPSVATSASQGKALITVIRSNAWGLGDEEDHWPVEVPADSTVMHLKQQIEELYELPAESQKLSTSRDPEVAGLDDNNRINTLGSRQIYLHPQETEATEEDQEAFNQLMGGFAAAMQETLATNAALAESLQGVLYTVHFQRPLDAGGIAAGKIVTLTFEAMALTGDIQGIVETELFGRIGAEPAYLFYNGEYLDPQVPLHFCGVDEDGKTVQVMRAEPPPQEQSDFPAIQFLPAGAALEDR
eukprot:TRINITY_DN94358_c0_g1_i1.p1 TRINITY_DN94358_c0_g1~~TRINITY_DN94358_c0_g1_i1.p1  ORF type:complete len:263 (-),score=47.80 TRINITY_DN94358_c0_g1_i1:280-1068(-)